MRHGNLHRRAVLGGAAALSLGLPGLSQASEPDLTAIELETNLFTRVGAAVRIGRHGPFTFVIDTGAAQTAIADTLLPVLGLTPKRMVRVHGITASELAPCVDIDALSLVGRRFRDLRCPVLPRRLLGADGLLGLDVLSRYRLHFDLQGQRATLISRTDIQQAEASGTRLLRDGHMLSKGPFGQMLISRMSVDGVNATAFIDSGAQFSVGNAALRRALSARQVRPAGADAMRRFTLYGVTGQSLVADMGVVADLRLAGRRMGETPLFFADLHCFSVMGLTEEPTLLIGADLLGRFREILIDFPRRTILFTGLRPRAPTPGLPV